MTTGKDIADAAARCCGTRFVHRGRVPGVGLDCVGLIVAAAHACGLNVHDAHGYSNQPDPGYAIAEVAKGAERVQLDQRQPGDLLCFQHRAGCPAHFGILLAGDMLVHADSRVGRVTIASLDRRWLRQLHSCWRLRGVA